jgi:hypothetical protein
MTCLFLAFHDCRTRLRLSEVSQHRHKRSYCYLFCPCSITRTKEDFLHACVSSFLLGEIRVMHKHEVRVQCYLTDVTFPVNFFSEFCLLGWHSQSCRRMPMFQSKIYLHLQGRKQMQTVPPKFRHPRAETQRHNTPSLSGRTRYVFYTPLVTRWHHAHHSTEVAPFANWNRLF